MPALLAPEELESGFELEAVEASDTQAEVREAPPAVSPTHVGPRQGGSGRRIWMLLGALALIVAAVVVLLALTAGEPGRARTDEGRADAPTTTVAGESSVRVSVEAVQPVSSRGSDGVQVVHGVLESSGVYLAVGQQILDAHEAGADEADAAVWQSTDGREWAAVGSATIEGVPGFQSMYGLIDVDGGLVAVGVDDRGGSSDAAVWRSEDSREWIRENREELSGVEGRQAMLDVIRVGDGYLAVGVDDSVDGTGDAAVWTSVDGISWSRVAEESLAGAPGRQEMFAVVVEGDRLLAAGSSVDAESGVSDAAIWESNDGGASWERIEAPGLAGSDGTQIMQDLAIIDGILVATGVDDGNDPDGDAAIWISPDAEEWRPVATEVLGGVPGRQEMFGLLPTADGLLVGGSSEGDLGLWRLELVG